VLAVGLVHHDDVGQLEHTFLCPGLLARAGKGQEHERVDHVGNGHLGLATPTVSTRITSNPAASSNTMVSRVALATPPRVPEVGDGRM